MEARPLPASLPDAVWVIPPAAASVTHPALPLRDSVPDPTRPRSPLEAHARQLVRALIETVVGRRPIAQLGTWASYAVLADIRLWAHHRDRLAGHLTPVSMRIQHPHRSAAEVSVRLATGVHRAGGSRSIALALRLDRMGSRWICTAVDAGPRPPWVLTSVWPAAAGPLGTVGACPSD